MNENQNPETTPPVGQIVHEEAMKAQEDSKKRRRYSRRKKDVPKQVPQECSH